MTRGIINDKASPGIRRCWRGNHLLERYFVVRLLVLFCLIGLSGHAHAIAIAEATKAGVARVCAALIADEKFEGPKIPVSKLSDPLKRFAREILQELFTEKRIGNIQGVSSSTWPDMVEVGGEGRTLIVRTPRGRYTFQLHSGTVEHELGERVAKLQELDYDGHVEGTVYLHPNWLRANALNERDMRRALMGLARSLFRADEYLHPHMKSPTAKEGRSYLTFDQRDDLYAPYVYAYEQHSRRRDPNKGPFTGAIVATGGGGKTIVNFRILHKTLMEGNPEGDYFLTFSVEDTDILEGTAQKFMREFGLSPNQVLVLTDKNAQKPIGPDVKVVFITRSNLINRADDVLAAGQGKRRRALVVDEGHHIGKNPTEGVDPDADDDAAVAVADDAAQAEELDAPAGGRRARKKETLDGQYQRFITRAKDSFGGEDQIIVATGTLWYDLKEEEENFIDNLVRDNIFISGLDEEEKEQFKKNVRMRPSLSVTAMRNTILQGYLAPIHNVKLMDAYDSKDVRDILQLYLSDQAGEEVNIVVEQVVDKIAAEIRANRIRHPFRQDRILVFMRRIARVNRVVELLRDKLRGGFGAQGRLQTQVYGYHSDKKTRFARAIAWFTRVEEFVNLKAHQILGVDKKFNEGVDAPGANAAVLLKRYLIEHGGRELMQNIWRIVRTGPGKTEAVLYAFEDLYRGIAGIHGLLLGNYIQENPEGIDDAANEGFDEDPEERAERLRRQREAREKAKERGEGAAGRALVVTDPNIKFRERDLSFVDAQTQIAGDDLFGDTETEGDEDFEKKIEAASLATDLPVDEIKVPQGAELAAAHELLARRFHPFQDDDGNSGSQLARRTLRILHALHSVSPSLYAKSIQGRPAEQLLMRYRYLVYMANNYRFFHQLSDPNAEGSDEETAQSAKEEMEKLNGLIPRFWNDIRSRVYRIRPEVKAANQVVLVSLNLTGNQTYGTYLINSMEQMYADFAKLRGWKEPQRIDFTPGAKYRNARMPIHLKLKIEGPGAFDLLRYEVGNHAGQEATNDPKMKIISVDVMPINPEDGSLIELSEERQQELDRARADMVRRYYPARHKFTQLRGKTERTRECTVSSLVPPNVLGVILDDIQAQSTELEFAALIQDLEGGIDPKNTAIPIPEKGYGRIVNAVNQGH